MAFTGKESEVVTLAEAAVWTANYRETIEQGETIAHFFGRENLNNMLEQDGCVGIRIYYGIDEEQKVLVLVGANEEGNDMVEGIIVERGVRCPLNCSNDNRLNS